MLDINIINSYNISIAGDSIAGHIHSCRWTLAKIKVASAYVLPRLSDYTFSGIWCLLRRMDMRYKCGRLHITSPDARYNEKKAWIEEEWFAFDMQFLGIV